MTINPELRYSRRRATVLGSSVAYVDVGTGDPMVFLHGNPTSAFLWRNVLPYLAQHSRCVAPDLIGMGESDKLWPSGRGSYRMSDHSLYLSALFALLGIERDVTFVVHEWGAALALDWAARNQGEVRAIAFMEAILRPLSWAEWPEATRRLVADLRSERGEELALHDNAVVEQYLPSLVLRQLAQLEMAAYRAPFALPGEARRPTLSFFRDIPLREEGGETVELVEQGARWLEKSTIPKLFIRGEPGYLLTGGEVDFCRSLSETKELTVEGLHYLPEDSPLKIAAGLIDWYRSL
ncbi:MAG: haloalkane dehalogenase [Acidimicrobiia bacterium]